MKTAKVERLKEIALKVNAKAEKVPVVMEKGTDLHLKPLWIPGYPSPAQRIVKGVHKKKVTGEEVCTTILVLGCGVFAIVIGISTLEPMSFFIGVPLFIAGFYGLYKIIKAKCQCTFNS